MGSHVVPRIERHCFADHWVAHLRHRAETVFSDLHRDFHGFLSALWNSSEFAVSIARPSDTRRWRRRAAAYGSINSG